MCESRKTFPHIADLHQKISLNKTGAAEGIRTPDPIITNCLQFRFPGLHADAPVPLGYYNTLL
ncbi:MAG: hypothetical protein HRT83_04270 [Hyphomicrobiaceae bacterium]|nr:hypothetical protein [Hyphomicrobiaceae bacterium]